MLRKVFKYDFNSIMKYWLPCALISLVVAVTAGLLGFMLDTMGDKYQIYCGVPQENVKTIVRYINNSTGEIIAESDSTQMNTN